MRAVIWTIVGILVVAAVVFLVVLRPKDAGLSAKPTAESIKSDAVHLTKTADRLAADIKELQARLVSPADKAKLAEVESKLSQLRDKIKALGGATGDAALTLKKEINGLCQDLNRSKRALEKKGGRK
jgi:chromosome segregation ATPase